MITKSSLKIEIIEQYFSLSHRGGWLRQYWSPHTNRPTTSKHSISPILKLIKVTDEGHQYADILRQLQSFFNETRKTTQRPSSG